MEFKNVVGEIVNGLFSGRFEADADEPAKGDEDFQEAVDTIAEILEEGEFPVEALFAAEIYLRDRSDHVEVDEIGDYLREHLRGSGYSIGEVLEGYAAGEAGEGTDLGRLYDALRAAWATDLFAWEEFAKRPVITAQGLDFVQVSTTGTAKTTFLFRSQE